MSLEKLINSDIKEAMLQKDRKKLEALRAVKAALLLEKTGKDVSSGEIPESIEMKLLQKLVKQRKENAAIFSENGRQEMAEEELYQAEIIQSYLPEQMSEEEIKHTIRQIINDLNASSMKDMGRVMAQAGKIFAGKADNKTISTWVKEMLGHSPA